MNKQPSTMANEANDRHISPLLQALKKASIDLQVNPIYTLLYQTDPRPAIESVLNLGAQAETLVSSDPSLTQSLIDLKTLSEKLEKLNGYGLRALFHRQVTKYEISQTAQAIESHIQSLEDRKIVENFLAALRSTNPTRAGAEEEEEAASEFRARLAARGFDRELQELIIRGEVFSALELALSAESTSPRVKDQAALSVLALVEFNRQVFVGLALMGPTVKSLVSISSLSCLRVLRSLIGAPLLGITASEARTLAGLVASKDVAVGLAAVDVVEEIAAVAPREVVEAMIVGEGLVAKLMELQRRIDRGDYSSGLGAGEAVKRSLALGSCVARLAASVEVGDGLDRRERREIRAVILRLIGECSVSQEEIVAVVAEVLWG